MRKSCLLALTFFLIVTLYGQNKVENYYLDQLRLFKGDSAGFHQLYFKDNKNSGNIYHFLMRGDYLVYALRPVEAMDEYNEALQLTRASKNDSLQALVNYRIGYLYFYNDNYTEAIKYFNRSSLVVLKPVCNWQAKLFINKGMIQNFLGKLEDANTNYKIAYSYFRQKKDSLRMSATQNNIALVYADLKEYSISEKYHDSCLQIRTRINDIYGVGQTYNNIGELYFKQHIYDKALDFFLKGMEFRMKGKVEESGIIESRINIGKTYWELGAKAEAIRWLEEAYALTKKINHLELQRRSAQHLKKIYFAEGNFRKAYVVLEDYHRLQDSLFGFDKKMAVQNFSLQSKLETKMKQDSIIAAEQLKAEKIIAEERESRNFYIVLFLSIGFIGLLFFVIQLIRTNRQRKKSNAIILEQKNHIDEKQKEILDSINYAKRIQYTLLAHAGLMKENLNDYMVLFKPKDIVSGDFYWATVRTGSNEFYLAVCDSTGHGVPGAFMSLLNISFLNEAINEKKIEQPHEVLNYVRERLIQNMEGGKDGMDAILVRFMGNKIQYAAANNRPVLIRNQQLVELSADKMPVGHGERKDTFRLFEETLQKGDTLYFYTDGFADQFGGPKGKKFKYSNLHKLLLENFDKEMNLQSQILNQKFEDWKDDLEQVDDVCIIGIKI